jgi:CheY-like chemotaxis protein
MSDESTGRGNADSVEDGLSGLESEPSESMQVIERLAASVAHEMNDVLAVVMGLASVLESELGPKSPLQSDVRQILTASRRGLRMTQNLLGFARKGTSYGERISLNDLVGVTSGLLRQTVPPEVELQTDLTDDLVDIEGDPTQVRHLLLNLATNAIDALPKGGVLMFATKNVDLTEKDLGSSVTLFPGRYARLHVSDTGLGMDDETIMQASEPFFSTKENAAGLGLAVVFDTVESLGGRIRVFSRVGLGTVVTIDIPEAEAAAEAEKREAPKPHVYEEGKQAILIVDDERMILSGVRRVVQKLGYEPVIANSGKQAIELFEKRRSEIAFSIVDLIMPHMDGTQVLKRIKQIDPDARVLISSGYSDGQQVGKMLGLGALGVINKPYGLSELSAALAEAESRRERLAKKG